jgi:hypothetical protein
MARRKGSRQMLLVYAGVAIAAVILVGAWLRFATRPVILAFGAGMLTERIIHRDPRAPGQHRSQLLQPVS